MLGVNHTVSLEGLSKAVEALGVPPVVMANLGSFLQEREANPLLSRSIAQLLLLPLLIVLPMGALLWPRIFSNKAAEEEVSTAGRSSHDRANDCDDARGLLARVRDALFPKTLLGTWKSASVFLPYFVPTSKESARGLAMNLAAMVAYLVLERVLNLVNPLMLRHVVDNLSQAVARTANTATVAASTATGATDPLGGAIAGNSSLPGYFPWRTIVAYVLSKQLILPMIRSYEWGLERSIWLEASHRISAASYRHLLSLGADFHEGGMAAKAAVKDEVKVGKEKKGAKKKKEKVETLSNQAWATICNSPQATARFMAHALFEIGPTILDLLLGVVSFWSFLGGRVAATMLALLALYLSAMFYFEDSQRAKWAEIRDVRQKRNNLASDAVRNWSTVSLFAREEYEHKRFVDACQAVIDSESHFKSGLFKDTHYAITRLVMVAGLLSLGLLSGWQIRQGERSVGEFVMLMDYWSEMVDNVRTLLYYFSTVDDIVVDVEKLADILSRQPCVRDREGAAAFALKDGSIEFDSVDFSYPGAASPALNNISFSIRGGQTVAVVGETGGGKSTLLKLLCRMRDCSSGTVRIDGQDVRDVTRASLLEHVAIVPQVIDLFGATVRENVSYGRMDAPQEDVEAACEAARLHGKITGSFADKYEEKVGAGGRRQLSGGEAQRLAIARALVRGEGARIVLFDEAMSSLDAETEWNIQRNVREWCKGRTVVIISHRLATVAHADLILAVKDGRVVEAGTQKELLKKGGYYHSLWTKQKLED